MKNNSQSKIYQFLTIKFVVFGSLFLTVIIMLIFNRIDAQIAGSDGPGIVDLQFAFSKNNFESVLAVWGKEGIDFFLNTIWIDFIYPVVYAVLLASAPLYIKKFVKDSHPDLEFKGIDEKIPVKYIILIPCIAALFDYTENMLHIIILSKRLFLENLIFMASVAALLKGIFIIVSLIIILSGYFTMRKAMREKMSISR